MPSDRFRLVLAPAFATLCLMASGDAPANTSPPSFCGPRELVIFSCRVGARMASVCASDNAAPDAGYVHFRFGKPDPGELLEVRLPANTTTPPASATGAAMAFSGGGGSWLRFRKGAFGFVAYTGIGKWGPKGEVRSKQGVVVETDGITTANMKCTGAFVSQLGPEWLQRVGITARGEEFDLPD